MCWERSAAGRLGLQLAPLNDRYRARLGTLPLTDVHRDEPDEAALETERGQDRGGHDDRPCEDEDTQDVGAQEPSDHGVRHEAEVKEGKQMKKVIFLVAALSLLAAPAAGQQHTVNLAKQA